MGRQLNQLFHQCGLREIECGVLAAEWSENTSQLEGELQMMQADLAAIGKEGEFLEHEKEIAKKEGAVYFIPTFYAAGRAWFQWYNFLLFGAWRSLASALAWGASGRRFKSSRPD